VEGNATTAHHLADRVARAAWFGAFVVPLILAALLLGVKSAQAAPPVAGLTPLSFEELDFEENLESEEDEAEFAAEECETAKEELAEGELTKAESDEICREAEGEGRKTASGSNTAPEECLLRSAHARLVADDSPGGVRLTVGYTTYEPTAATVDFSARGGKGMLHLGTSKHHLGRSGVVRLSKALAESEMAKVDAAGRFTVQIHIPGAPAGCRRFATEQLTVKTASRDQAVWSQPS
jgi:hypothetical protein